MVDTTKYQAANQIQILHGYVLTIVRFEEIIINGIKKIKMT